MKKGDVQLGKPYQEYTDTKAAIEAFTSPTLGMTAVATDNPAAPLGTYNGSAWVWSNQQNLDTFMFGFVTNYDGTQETTIAFDGTNTFTLAPTGTTWSYYRNGIKYTITGSKTVTLSGSPPASKGLYYIYIDATDGTLTASTVSWNLEDTKVCVATVAWDNSATPKYWLSDERHSCSWSRRLHWEHHYSEGSEIITAPVLSGYTVTPAVPADTDNTFAISQSIMADENIKHILTALSDPNGTNTDYVVDFRASGTWNWESSAMPYRYTAAGYIQFDSAGTMTQGQTAKFYNSYFLLTNRAGAARFGIFHGQAEFSTLAAAQSEKFSDLVKTGIQIDEFVACYQLTWATSAAYSTKGKCRLASAPAKISVSASGFGAAGAIDHEALSNLLGGASGDHYHLTSAERTSVLAAVDDTSYDATSWDGDTTHAPSKNAVRDKIQSMGAGSGIPITGWIEEVGTWTRTGNYTFTIPTDVTAIYRKGTKVRYKDGGAYEYGVVISSSYGAPNTTVTLATNSDYAMAAATITNPAYSHVENPEGFPHWFNYSPSYSASGSMTWTSVTTTFAKFFVIGTRVFFVVDASGTTGGTASTALRATAPIECITTLSFCAGCVINDGASAGGNWGIIQASPDYITVNRYDVANYGLGASRRIRVEGFYEME